MVHSVLPPSLLSMDSFLAEVVRDSRTMRTTGWRRWGAAWGIMMTLMEGLCSEGEDLQGGDLPTLGREGEEEDQVLTT